MLPRTEVDILGTTCTTLSSLGAPGKQLQPPVLLHGATALSGRGREERTAALPLSPLGGSMSTDANSPLLPLACWQTISDAQQETANVS